MNDTQLVQRLRGLDTPVDPSPRFADELFGSVNRERQRRSGRRFSIERPQLLQMAAAGVATFVILGIGWAYLAGPREPAATPVVISSPSPSPTTTPSAPATVSTSQTPFPPPPTQANPWRLGARPPVPIASFLDSNDGLVWAFGLANGRASSVPHELDLMSYEPLADTWTNYGRITYESDRRFPFEYPGVIGPDGDVYLFAGGVDESDEPVVWRIDLETMAADGPSPQGWLGFTPEVAPDGTIYFLETPRATTPDQLPQRLWTYDPIEDSFVRLPAIPEDRAASLLVADDNGYVHVIGGTTFPDTEPILRLDTTYIYDPVAGTWAQGSRPPSFAGTNETNEATLGSDGAIYIMNHAGGHRLFRLAPNGTEWTQMPTPPEATNSYFDGMQGATGHLVLLDLPDRVVVADLSELISGL